MIIYTKKLLIERKIFEMKTEWVIMKKFVSVALLLFFVLTLTHFTQKPSRQHNVSYQLYKEEFTSNLKNPLIERYRKLSFEVPREVLIEENENEEL